jgi:CSLREA domain-containing protein
MISKPYWMAAVIDSSAGTVTLSGTPPTYGSSTVQLEATDAAGVKGAKNYGLWIGPQRAFTWSPDPATQNDWITFSPVSAYNLSVDSWWRGDTCETYIDTYSIYANVVFEEVGTYQICMKYWVDSLNDFAWDKQLVTVTRRPPDVWIHPEPSFPGEVVYGNIDFYSYGEGSFSCTIDWGDGTTEGPIDPFPGENFCEVSHTYATVGSYTVTASVTEVGGSTETGSRQHHVVYYYTWGPDFWLTSNEVPTTIMLQAFAAPGIDSLIFTISSPPSQGILGTPELIDCYPLTMESLDSAVVSPAISAAGPAPQSVPEGKQPTTDFAALRDLDSSTKILAAEGPMICLANVVYTPTIPDPSYVGWDDFSFTVSDGVNAASAPGNVQLYLAPNTPPVAQDSSVKVAAASPTYVVLTATDSDVYNYNTDWLRFSIIDGPSNGTLGVPSWAECRTIYDEFWYPQGVTCTSTVLYTPEAGTSATTDSFTFKANDSHYDSNTATVSLTLHTPTTVTVNSSNDNVDGSCDTSHCSLREAVLYSGPGDTINFAPTILPSTITLVNGQLLIDKDLTIVGPGADLLAISGGAELEDPDPYAHDRVFSIGTFEGAPVNVSISGLTIRDGRAEDGGGVMVYSGNTLYMEDCVIGPNNIVTYAGGGIMNYEGDVTLNRCTVTENEGTGSLGGAGVTTAYGGTTTLINSTVSGNITNNFGGGLFVYDSVVRLIHTTVSGNISNANFDEPYEERGGGAGIYFDPYGGGLVELHNSIVAGNTDMWYPEDTSHVLYPDVFGSITSLGGNLIGDITGTSIESWLASDQVGTAAAPINPLLGLLALNSNPALH